MTTLNTESPAIVCLVGPARFAAEWRAAWLAEVTAGRVVVGTPDLTAEIEDMPWGAANDAIGALRSAHMRLIDMASELLVVTDATGYTGKDTRDEIAYARGKGKEIRSWAPAAGSVTP